MAFFAHLPDTAAMDSVPPTPANSLFVANLPHRMSNHELAWALLAAFRPFGPLRLIRASRDPAGRPFGFVDYCREDDGTMALEASRNGIEMGGRVCRVERARFQARLIVTPRLCDIVGGDRLGSLFPQAITMLKDQQDRTILQFDDRESAIAVYEQLRECPGVVGLCWLLPGHHATGQQAVVRSSGLVQLAPDGSDLVGRPPQLGRGITAPQSNVSCRAAITVPTNSLCTYEEEASPFLNGDDLPLDEVYVGRLCSWRITRDLLRERFGQYGTIHYIRLFNRGVIRPEHPVDAFAHIGFEQGGGQRAREREDGQCWLGQIITVQSLIIQKAIKVQSVARTLFNGHDRNVDDDFEVLQSNVEQ